MRGKVYLWGADVEEEESHKPHSQACRWPVKLAQTLQRVLQEQPHWSADGEVEVEVERGRGRGRGC